MKDFEQLEVEGFKRTGGNKKLSRLCRKYRILSYE